MKKAVLIVLALLIVAVPVFGLSVKNAVESFFIDEVPLIVIGDQLNADDEFAAIAFQNEFGVEDITPASAVLLDTDKTMVSIGGPCANPVWTAFTGEECSDWQHDGGMAAVKSITTDSGKTVLLISGTSGKNTRAAAKHVIENFGEAIFNKDDVVLDVEGLPLANDALIVYKEVGSVGEGQSSAQGSLIIEIPNDPSGGTLDLATGLKKSINAGYPNAIVTILEQDSVSMSVIRDKIFVLLSDPPLISVEKEAPADHVVIAAASAFWLSGQGYPPMPPQTHNQLLPEDLIIT